MPSELLATILVFVYFIYGAILGSFLNVCIIRIPQKRSVAYPPSTCKCGKRVEWRDNIPILSWILLRGKSRCCKSKLPVAYPLVEASVAVIWAAIASLYYINISLPMCILTIVLCIVVWLKVLYLGIRYNIFQQ